MSGPSEERDEKVRRRYMPDMLTELFQDPLDPGYADATRHRAEHGPTTPWRRRGATALRLIVLVVTGFLLAVAYRHAAAAEPERVRAHAGLVEEARGAQDRTDQMQRQADSLRESVSKLRDAALGGAGGELGQLREQEAVTGLAKVNGDGLVVRLSDAPAQMDPTTGKEVVPENGRVLDIDLQEVVNGVWSAGAEAIAVNGQRLTATSTIRTAGGAILVDFQPVTSPYEVAAIGPDDLRDRFERSVSAARVAGLANQYALQFSMNDADDLTLPAAGTDIPLHYAVPDVTPPPPPTPSPTPSGGGG